MEIAGREIRFEKSDQTCEIHGAQKIICSVDNCDGCSYRKTCTDKVLCSGCAQEINEDLALRDRAKSIIKNNRRRVAVELERLYQVPDKKRDREQIARFQEEDRMWSHITTDEVIERLKEDDTK